jgi:Na+-driven multidrug efflux pump
MVAAAKESDRVAGDDSKNSLLVEDDDYSSMPKAARILKGSLQLSMLVGLFLGGFVFVFAKPLLLGIMGGGVVGTDTNSVMLQSAMAYVRIRALAMPAAALLGCGQTASLCMQDVRSPMLLTALAASVNMIGNACLVKWLPMPIACLGGAAGSAAWATVLAQYTSVAFFFYWIMTSSSSNPSLSSSSSLQGTINSSRPHGKLFNNRNKSNNDLTVTRSSSPTRGFLAGRFSLRDLLLPRPSKETVRGFAAYFVPVTTTQAGRAATSIAIDHVVASCFGTIGMAANQIITSVYAGLVTPVADSLNLAGQSFAPGIALHENGPEKGRALGRLRNNLLRASVVCGLLLTVMMAAVTIGTSCQMFTSDPVVVHTVQAIVPILLVAASLQGTFSACEGLLLGQKDLGFLTKLYGIYSFAVPYILWQVKKAAQAGSTNVSLASVWQVFVGYALTRIVVMGGRVWWLNSKASQRVIIQPQQEHQRQDQRRIQMQRVHQYWQQLWILVSSFRRPLTISKGK